MKTTKKRTNLNRKVSLKRLLFAASCLWLLPACAWAQYNVFVFVDGIEGEAISPTHPNTIEATGFSFGTTNTLTSGCGRFADLSVAKFVDKASPRLMLHCASGLLVVRVNIYVQKVVNGSPHDYLELRLDNAKISGVTNGNSTNGQPTEVVTFRPEQVTMTYTILAADGSVQGQVHTCFMPETCHDCSK